VWKICKIETLQKKISIERNLCWSKLSKLSLKEKVEEEIRLQELFKIESAKIFA